MHYLIAIFYFQAKVKEPLSTVSTTTAIPATERGDETSTQATVVICRQLWNGRLHMVLGEWVHLHWDSGGSEPVILLPQRESQRTLIGYGVGYSQKLH